MAGDGVVQTFLNQLANTPSLEGVAVITAIGYVVLAAKQNILCWLFALVSTICYVIVFWQVSLPFQTALNGYYVVMAVYGFWQWRQGENDVKPVTQLTGRQHTVVIGSVAIITVLMALLWQEVAFTRYVYIDVFVTVASVATTLLVAHKKLENWLYWIVVNTAAAWLYWQVDLFLTSVLFLLYCVLSVYGFVQWRKDYLPRRRETQGNY